MRANTDAREKRLYQPFRVFPYFRQHGICAATRKNKSGSHIMMEAMMTVLPMDGDQLRAALRNEVKDFEDMLQYQSALAGHCDCIVTINTNDFVEFSSLPVYSPEGLLDLLDEESV